MTSALVFCRDALASFRTQRALHIFVLCAFAFSEPLFSALTQQFVYLHDLQAGWGEICYVVLMLAVVIPAAWVFLDYLAMCGSSRFGGRGRDLVLGFLFGLVWLSLLRPFMGFNFLQLQASVWLVSLVIATVGAILAVRLYQKSLWIRRWVSVATVGLVCFPGLFLYRYGSLSRVHERAAMISVAHPVPVVLVVFDEFSGTTLMDANLEIDGRRFPQFERLAKVSTWYRQASTVHIRTDIAVPAILSGQFPTVKRPPLESEYPGNLFRLVHGTRAFEMTVFEPISRLCPNAVRTVKRVERTALQKIDSVTRTLATVYPRLLLPNDTPIDFPPISRLWFGLPEVIDESNDRDRESGLFREEPFALRDGQLQTFLQNLRPTERVPFNFLHIELPHVPWCFLPSGHNYNFNDNTPFDPAGAWGDIGEDWGTDAAIVMRNEHRYLQQVRFVDRFVGQLLDRLKDVGLLDECLLIVTADHGVSFRPGHSRRIPDKENLADLLSVPLFVKLPGQNSGRVSDSNVESVDILPTIAEILGIELTEPVDGIPVSMETRRPRKSLYFNETMIALEPVIPQLKAVVDRRLAIFAEDSLDIPPLQASSHAAWHGHSTREFLIDDKPLPSLSIEPIWVERRAAIGDFIPCLVSGTLDPRELQEPTADLILAVNGVILDSGLSFPKGRRVHGFEFLLPQSVAEQNPCLVELFHAVRATSEPSKLRRLGEWNMYDRQ